MRRRMIMGVLAAAGCILLPLLVCGGTGAGGVAESAQPAAAVPPTETADSQRTILEIIVHQGGSWDAATTLTLAVDGEARTLTLHDYLVGVLMAEMPADYGAEALKAQAVASRTYTLYQQQAGKALSSDSATCQGWTDPATAADKWGADWETYLAKLEAAVADTDGQVLTYDGNLINATYFASSGGATESAAAVWGGSVPYLVSVESPGEAGCGESAVTVPMADFLAALGIDTPSVGAVTYTDGGGVNTAELGGSVFSGVELRRLFGLRSTRFSMEVGEDAVTFNVTGYGHRVGLSQYGAEVMAENGSGYEEILTRYYTGVALETLGE